MCCAVLSRSVVSNSLRPQELEPPRFLCPWGFSRQEHWSGSPCPLPGDLSNPGIKPRSPELQADPLLPESPGKPTCSFNKRTSGLGKDQGHRAGGGGEGGEGFRCREQLRAEIYISLQVIPAERRPDKDYSSVEEESRAQREKSERP